MLRAGRAPDMPRGGRQPPDLNHGTARRRWNGRPVAAPGLAALPQRPPCLYVQELAFPGGLRLHTGTGETARPPGAPRPPRWVSGRPPVPGARTPALGDPSPGAPGTRGDPSCGAPARLWALQGPELCPPLQMAAAGFIHCPTENEPDLAQCFFCFKELEGWEPDDDPM